MTSYFVIVVAMVIQGKCLILLSASICAVFIRGRSLFEGSVYLWKYGIHTA